MFMKGLTPSFVFRSEMFMKEFTPYFVFGSRMAKPHIAPARPFHGQSVSEFNQISWMRGQPTSHSLALLFMS